MQIKSLGYERQYGLCGQIVNVPLNIDSTVQSLPRCLDDTQTIQLHLKKRLSFKSYYMCESIRPKVIYAGKYLEKTPLYQLYGVKFSNDLNQDCSIEGDI